MFYGASMSQLPPSINCGNCHKIFKDPQQLDCGGKHTFCLECVKKILESTVRRRCCPECHSDIKAYRPDTEAQKRAESRIRTIVASGSIFRSVSEPGCSTDLPQYEKSEEELACEAAYNNLMAEQVCRRIHPSRESMETCTSVVKTFLEIFLNAPEYMKKVLATSPLFPMKTKFSTGEHLYTTCPINYITFTGCVEGLIAIQPFLSDEEWHRPGLFNSTWMHCIIAGMASKSCTYGFGFQAPLECAKIVLARSPEFAAKTNKLGTTPLQYLETVRDSAIKTMNNIMENGHGGFGGMGKSSKGVGCYEDFDYLVQMSDLLIEHLKSILV